MSAGNSYPFVIVTDRIVYSDFKSKYHTVQGAFISKTLLKKEQEKTKFSLRRERQQKRALW